MAKLLALDTSTHCCSVAIMDGDKLLSTESYLPREHTRLLLPMVDELLVESGLNLKSLDAIAFGVGPGSFTGLRICLGVVQGLAFSSDLPVLPVSTLAAMSLQLSREPSIACVVPQPGDVIVPVLDARMDQVYWAMHGVDDDGQLRELMEPTLSSCDGSELQKQLRARGAYQRLIGIGEGWKSMAAQQLDGLEIFENILPHAREIADLGQKLWSAGGACDVADVQPLYLRSEVNWQKRVRIRNGHDQSQ